MQTAVQEESKNVKEDLRKIIESGVREETQDIKKEIKAMSRGVFMAAAHQEAKDVNNPLGGKNNSTDRDSSLAPQSQLSEGRLYILYVTQLIKCRRSLVEVDSS